jgi:thymidylate kinase
MSIRRVCLFGGPGAGKSTLAMGLAAALKSQGVEAEYAHEYVKAWAFLEIPITGFDQLYIFSKQIRQEDVILRNSGSIVVTDSPPLMSVAYAGKRYKFPSWEALRDIAIHFEKTYPTLNLFVDRSGLAYSEEGRYENEEEALVMDNSIKDFIEESGSSYETVKFNDLDAVKDLVLSRLSEPGDETA